MDKERLEDITMILKESLAAFLVENDEKNYSPESRVQTGAFSINNQVKYLVYEIDKQLSYL